MENERYTGDAVARHGYAIYDRWQTEKYSSRRIVTSVELAVSAVNRKPTITASLEALAHLFALDMRVQERYSTLFRCLLSFFSWRRETEALKRLRAVFHIPVGLDARTAIEVELQKLRERIAQGEIDDDDEDVHGGRQNGKTAEEEAARDEKQGEKTAEAAETAEPAEEKNQETSEKEKSEEKADEPAERTPAEEQTEAVKEGQELQPMDPEEALPALQGEAEIADRVSEPSAGNNGPEVRSEPSTNKSEEAPAYNDTVDSPPLFEGDTQGRRETEATSFIDEVIMDNMIKGKEDIIGHNPLQDVGKESEMGGEPDPAMQQGEEAKNSGKDAYLYDQEVMDARTEDVKPTEAAPETKTEAAKPTPQNQQTVNQNAEAPAVDQTAESIKSEFKNLRVPLQVEITLDEENEMRRGINDQMTEEAILEHIRLQTDAWREQISIAELSMDDSVVQVARPVPPKAEPARTIASRK